jgi:hypothetical protein
MKAKAFAVLAWLAANACLVGPGRADTTGYDEIHVSKAALSGQQIRIWHAAELNPDCTEVPGLIAQVVQPPAHGTATLSKDQIFPYFPPGNPRSVCNTRKTPGFEAFYTSADGYRGTDIVVLQVATTEGRVRKVTVDIDVK